MFSIFSDTLAIATRQARWDAPAHWREAGFDRAPARRPPPEPRAEVRRAPLTPRDTGPE
ncbi:hypothetical protein [Wenxinia marina]|uniref:Uncharacterized protein n=2 Tax=Wenxinia TaxID=653686 RepID=A0A0D0NS79_9RHOB|nr:hypothetical protein [Wenxinia marina]KIQ71090.1 hypothetical protein Wenmar_00468 [Wenxinia marina DSM 24838]GGL54928.1 hypothetical protein GCM10011392_06660 [Wenxinia marina]